MMPAMSGKDDYDDDYVARLLIEDAKTLSTRYASSASSRSSAIRPNTRFLNNIIREVDSHNSTLRDKERREARSRLQGLQQSEGKTSKQAIEYNDRRNHKRRKYDHDDDHVQRRHRRREHRESVDGLKDPENNLSDRHHRDQEKKRHQRDDYKCESSKGKPENASALRSYRVDGTGDDHSDGENKEKSIDPRSSVQKRLVVSQDDTDVLDDIVNRTVASKDSQPRIRGRGAGTTKSHIDEHFSTSYDPTQDVEQDPDLDSDVDDWTMALEAARDRAMWKRKQSERLREAGWDNEQISKWERGSLNNPELDQDARKFEWTRKGETRAWDVGK